MVWWCMSVIPAFRGLRQEDQEFYAKLGYKKIPCQKKKKKKKGLSR
jgi:hypothetical protein